MPDYKLLIFDWDGTLVDSIGRIVDSMRVASDACGLPQRDDARIKGIIGLGLPEAVASLYPELDDAYCIEMFRHHYSQHYFSLEHQPSALFAGVGEALQAFREAGYLLAVATGKSRMGLDRVLHGRGWESFFDVTRCADETASKPEPLMLEQIMAHCAVEPAQALMVGDSIFDLQMARNAGVDSVAVGYGAQSLDELDRYGPRLAINEFSQLRAWLESPARQSIEVSEHVG